jgi:uncharacterized repeat protein (TIGR03803 family)
MKIRIHRLCALILISLLWLFAVAAPANPQGQINPIGRSPRLRGNTGKTHKAKTADGAASYEYGVLYNFCSDSGCKDGVSPEGGLILDSAGNLYGTTNRGGANSTGVLDPDPTGAVFKLAPPAQPGDTWTQTVLYSFCSGGGSICTDGAMPSAGLIRDSAGNLYGTTNRGGANKGGTVFKLDTAGQETVLYSFCSETNCTDGADPDAGLIQDTAGNLYGVTDRGGANTSADGGVGGGTVFKLAISAQPGGGWTETVLYSFCSESNCTDGDQPSAGLIQDADGNLYGTTIYGGANTSANSGLGGGAVFELAPPAQQGGVWTETALYSFCSVGGSNCTDGDQPAAGLILDAAGNLYGTTYVGGANTSANDLIGGGTAFKVAPPAQQGGAWTEMVLYSFCSVGGSSCTDGTLPSASLIQDSAGNLYGTTTQGGTGSGGTVFELAAPAQQGGTWTETMLYSFCSAGGSVCTDGGIPSAGLIRDAAGNLYGTTSAGGANSNGGTVFELAPPIPPSFAVTTTAVTINAGATSGNTSTITLTPSGGFTGNVTLTAAITSTPTGAQNPPTLSFGATSPVSITGTSAVTATLTITTTAPTSGALAYPARPGVRWYAGGTTLAFGLLLGIGIYIPARRRSWRMWLGLVLLVILAGGLLSCSSSSSGGTSNPGTTPGVYTVTVTGTSGSTTATNTVTLTVF